MAKIKIEKHDSVKMYRIRKTLDEISDKTGHGTELITVYIPKGKQLHEVISILKEEQGTADNIKSDFTRSHVVDSLGKVIQRLKMYKKTPERGLVVFHSFDIVLVPPRFQLVLHLPEVVPHRIRLGHAREFFCTFLVAV